MPALTQPLKLGAQEFIATQFVDADYDEVVGWFRNRFLDNAYKAAKTMPKDDGDRIISVALKDALKIVWGDEIALSILQTYEGGARVGWQMIKKRHPAINFSEFKKLAYLEGGMDEILKVWTYFNEAEKEAQGGASTENIKSEVESGIQPG